LFRSLAQSYNIAIEEVYIYNLVEGIFYARIVANLEGHQVEIDARTSDAVAIAVRFNCPIYCEDFILEQAGVSAEEAAAEMQGTDEEVDLEELTAVEDPEKLSVDELQRQLDQALEREEYEKASRLRDEIQKRSSGK
jgi:bifunctional DNase/RNase